MKILVICQYYDPENFQINDICEQLIADEQEVTVLTGLPNYPTGIVPEDYKKGHRDEVINGVHVLRCFEIGRGTGALQLGLNYISFYLSAMRKISLLKADFDIVFVYQLSPILMGLPGRYFSKKNHIPLLLYCCDLWPESMKMYVKSERSILFRFIKKISTRVYSSCERIICQSSSFIPYMKEVHKIPEDKLTYLPAFADEQYLSSDFTATDDIVDFVFLGNLGIAQDLISVLQAIKEIKGIQGFKVHFVGDGSCLNEMKTFVHNEGLEKIVFFYGRRPVSEMPDFYKLADVCLVSLRSDNQTGLTLPSKVQGYMAAGKPIVGMINGSAKDVIEESACGICVPAGDIHGLAEALRKFILQKECYEICGQNGREFFIRHFSKNVFMKKLYKEFDSVKETGNVNI